MTDEHQECGAIYTDMLNPDALLPPTVCTLEQTHTGPHHNPNGTTWGGPTEWGIV